MIGLKHIKNKRKSEKSLQKTIKKLDQSSEIKIKKKTESYKDFMEDFLTMTNFIRTKVNLFGETNLYESAKKELVILITSDKGLGSGLNTKVLKNFNSDFKEKKANTEVFCIGKKSLEFAVKSNYSITGETTINDNFSENDLSTLYTFLISAIDTKKYSHISLYFNYFKNTTVQVPVNFQLFPLTENSFNQFTKNLGVNLKSNLDNNSITLEPTPKIIRDELIKQLIQHMLYGAILQNKSGDYNSHTVVVKNTITPSLSTKFTKERQRMMAKKIISTKMFIE
ncbi:MAG TPA: FoF1 ATP synthase subunit gamma [Candidatus Absconditabacterales bacterium]|nr:FoF1 ATP synthase subunit gamma [Candidatus Absconditabacterales bacterium]HMT26827.1 FoF1 ATP synthase subunit gamma [Candidatus Absconditabacterales bacterium]